RCFSRAAAGGHADREVRRVLVKREADLVQLPPWLSQPHPPFLDRGESAPRKGAEPPCPNFKTGKGPPSDQSHPYFFNILQCAVYGGFDAASIKSGARRRHTTVDAQ